MSGQRDTIGRFHGLVPVEDAIIPQWRAVEEGTGREVVLLYLRPDSKRAELTARARALRDAAPEGIQTVLEVYDDPESPGVTVALARQEGPLLRDLLEDRALLPPDQTASLIAELARRLEQARRALGWSMGGLSSAQLRLTHGSLVVSLEEGLGGSEPAWAALDTFDLGRLLVTLAVDRSALTWRPTDIQPAIAPWLYERGPDGLGDPSEGLWAIGRRAVGAVERRFTPTPGELLAELSLWRFERQGPASLNAGLAQVRACLQDDDLISLGAFLCANPRLLTAETIVDYVSQHIGDRLLKRLTRAEHLTGPEQFLITWLHTPEGSTLPSQTHVWNGERLWYQRAMAQIINALPADERDPRLLMLGTFPYLLPPWASEVEAAPLPSSPLTEDTLRHAIRAHLGSDTGGEERWREALVTWAVGNARFDGFPVYLGHCFMAGERFVEAARLYSALYHYAETQREVGWYLCYLAYSAGRAWQRADHGALSRFWLHRAQIFANARDDAIRYYARAAGELLRKSG